MSTVLMRRGYAAEWTSKDPVLKLAEAGYERDTGKFKIGDGISRWTALSYFSPSDQINGGFGPDFGEALDAHINSTTPHPVYDDGPSFVLLYQNAKV